MLEETTSTTQPYVLPGLVTPVRLGEELPIFCERCGYSLHGLPQKHCEACAIRHFHCPECGHTQPINTLRPAVQRILGRLRGWVLSLVVFGKLAFIGFFLFMWFVMGVEWSYTYSSELARMDLVIADRGPYPRGVTAEAFLAFGMFGLAFGMVCRMLLLRWRNGAFVGLWLAALVFLAIVIGARFYQWDRESAYDPLTLDFILTAGTGFGAVVLGASVVWPIWTGLARIFLPPRTANALLAWQCSLSEGAPTLARE